MILMNKRRRPDPTVEARVLMLSGRRCCLCLVLDHDSDEKEGQIAHLDHNPANSAEQNLVFLCLKHHSRYDSTTSQHKNYTLQEVQDARRELYRRVQARAARHKEKMLVGEGSRTRLESRK